jgi:Ran GTPase-activating protein (RanGAP) involved in mRNA processing and transport
MPGEGNMNYTLGFMPQPTTLDFDTNSIMRMGIQIAKTLAASLHNIPRLAKLNISNLIISKDGAQALFGAFVHVPHLQELYLRHCNIGYEGSQALGEALVHVPQLRVLDLRGNYNGEFTPVKLIHVPKLQVLDLGFTDIIVIELAKALIYLPELTKLGLDGNPINADEAIAIVRALAYKPPIIVLGKQYNPPKKEMTIDDEVQGAVYAASRMYMPGLKVDFEYSYRPNNLCVYLIQCFYFCYFLARFYLKDICPGADPPQ